MKKYSTKQLIKQFKNIECLCVDADGTLTDGGMYLDENNIATRRFYAHDGTAINMIKHLGIKVAIITTSVSPIMIERGKILGFDEVIIGSHNKGNAIKDLCKKLNVNIQNTIHMGDDVNDILGFQAVGYPIAVKNSAPAIFDFSCYITKKNGGDGAVREICDLILLAKTGKLYGPPYVDYFIQ